jgi:cell division protein DivIC
MWKKLQKKISKLPWWSTNPFCLATAAFLVWMLFIDDNNLINQYRKHSELSALLEKKDFFVQQIKKTDKEYFELTTNPATQEKFAREHYWMKRDNEDVFVIVPAK